MIHGQFILVTDDELSEGECRDLEFLLSDALQDFQHARKQNARQYVDERYGPRGSEYWHSWSGDEAGQLKAYDNKVSQVEARLTLARLLHNAAVGVTVKTVPDLIDWLEDNESCEE